MKKIICASVALLAIIAVTAVTIANFPTSRFFLRQAEDEIRNYILELTPIGMNMEEARSVIEHRFQVDEWGYGRGSESAFIDYENGVVRAFNPRLHAYPPPQIGVKAIQVYLGQYRRSGRLLASTFVFAAWGFDENSELVDVHVSKSRPAM